MLKKQEPILALYMLYYIELIYTPGQINKFNISAFYKKSPQYSLLLRLEQGNLFYVIMYLAAN